VATRSLSHINVQLFLTLEQEQPLESVSRIFDSGLFELIMSSVEESLAMIHDDDRAKVPTDTRQLPKRGMVQKSKLGE
jgi:hypothetical protein